MDELRNSEKNKEAKKVLSDKILILEQELEAHRNFKSMLKIPTSEQSTQTDKFEQ